jgi:hypothetical protein
MQNTVPRYISSLVESITDAAELVSLFVQVLNNHRLGLFAGLYALTAYLSLARMVAIWASYVPGLVGRFEGRPGLDIASILSLTMAVWHVITGRDSS